MKLIVCCGTHEALFYVSLNASQISRFSFCTPHPQCWLTHRNWRVRLIYLLTRSVIGFQFFLTGFFIVRIISIGIILSSTNQVEQNSNLSGASAVCSLSPFLQPHTHTRKKVANFVKFLKVAYFLEIGSSWCLCWREANLQRWKERANHKGRETERKCVKCRHTHPA